MSAAMIVEMTKRTEFWLSRVADGETHASRARRPRSARPVRAAKPRGQRRVDP
jgi:hypothetical protein